MRELPLLDRDGELAAIAAAIAAIPGRGSGVYFEAAAGLGKSRLLATARNRAQPAGLLVLSARGTELEQGFAFGLARRLFAPHVPAAGAARRRVLGKAAAAAGPLHDGSMPLAPADPTRIGLIEAALGALTARLAGAAVHRGECCWAGLHRCWALGGFPSMIQARGSRAKLDHPGRFGGIR